MANPNQNKNYDRVQNEGSKPDVQKERLAGRSQEQMILDKQKEMDEKREKDGEDAGDKTIVPTTNDLLYPLK